MVSQQPVRPQSATTDRTLSRCERVHLLFAGRQL